MLKRLLLAVALAASTLLITGTVAGTAQAASGPGICAPGEHASTTAGRCSWRGNCYWCYNSRTRNWERQYCR